MSQRYALVMTLVVSACLALCACAADQDDGLAARVKERLADDETVRSASIDVDSDNGVVTLTGNVDNPGQKEQALAIARTTEGVTDVVDRIAAGRGEGRGADAPDVDRTAGEVMDDASLTRQVKARLLEDELVRGLRIDVDTRDGVVYLTGTVRSEQERDRAVELTRTAPGVRDVQANLTVQRT